MMGRTHLAAGVTIGTVMTMMINEPFETEAIILGCASIGSLLPDIDIGNSKLGRLILPISIPLNLIFGHRGFIHSPVLYLALSAIGLTFLPDKKLYILAALIGVISHLILDMLNPEGIPLLYPISKKHYSFAGIKTGSIWESLCFVGSIFLAGHFFGPDILDFFNRYEIVSFINEAITKL